MNTKHEYNPKQFLCYGIAESASLQKSVSLDTYFQRREQLLEKKKKKQNKQKIMLPEMGDWKDVSINTVSIDKRVQAYYASEGYYNEEDQEYSNGVEDEDQEYSNSVEDEDQEYSNGVEDEDQEYSILDKYFEDLKHLNILNAKWNYPSPPIANFTPIDMPCLFTSCSKVHFGEPEKKRTIVNNNFCYSLTKNDVKCYKGDSCEYAHNFSEINDCTCTKTCTKTCKQFHVCRNVHKIDETVYVNASDVNVCKKKHQNESIESYMLRLHIKLLNYSDINISLSKKVIDKVLRNMLRSASNLGFEKLIISIK